MTLRSWRNRVSHSLVSLLALSLFACGGGGSDSGTDGGTSSGGTAISIGNSGLGPITSKSFTFAGFGINSKLTVPTNFQPNTQTTTTTAQAVTTLSRTLTPPLAKLARAQALTRDAVPHCGTTEARVFAEVMDLEDSHINPRQDPTIRARFENLAAGSREDFFLLPGFTTITAEKVLEPNQTTHCTIFAEVDSGTNMPVISTAKAMMVAEAFDSNNPQRPGSGIYDQVRAVFGSEWTQGGGIDGDSKIVIVFFSSSTLGSSLFGYISPVDGKPNAGNTSNQGEIIYINADKSDYQTRATLTHEFQHLINQNEKVSQQGTFPAGAAEENVSLNEGLSELAEEVCGYTFATGNTLLATVTNDYLEKPERHEFFDFFQAGFGYGQGYLFFKYVREQFGDGVIRAICTNPGTGMSNLNANLPVGFPETFRRWTIANYATNLTGPVPNIYTYPSGFKTNGNTPAGQLVGVNTIPMTGGTANASPGLNAWSTAYLVFSNGTGADLQVTIQSAPGSPIHAILEQTANQFTSLSQ